MDTSNPLLIALKKVCKDCKAGILYVCECHTCHVKEAISSYKNNKPELELSEKVKRLESIILTIQAWDIDKRELRGHHCLAKQWVCSLQDQIKRYKKGKRLK